MLMYTALVIPLSLDSVAKLDIQAGQRELSDTSSENSAPLTDYPYYGLFVVDLIMM